MPTSATLPYLDPYVAASTAALAEFLKASTKPQIFEANGKTFAVDDPTGNGMIDIGGGTFVSPKMLGTPMIGGPAKPTETSVTDYGYDGFDSGDLVLPDLSDIWSNPLVRNTFDDIVDIYGGAYGSIVLPPAAGDAKMINADYHQSYSSPWKNEDGSSWSTYTTDTTASLKGLESGGTTVMSGVASYYQLDQWGSDYPKDYSSNWTKTTGTGTLTLEETPITFGYSADWGRGELYDTVLHTATFSFESTNTSGSSPATGSEPVTNTDWSVTFSQLGGDTSPFTEKASDAFATLTNPYQSAGGAMSDLAQIFASQGYYDGRG